MRASKEYLDAVEAAGYNVDHLRPKPTLAKNCEGEHRFFVAETGVTESGSKVIVILCCLSCGQPLKHEFEIIGTQPVRLQNKK